MRVHFFDTAGNPLEESTVDTLLAVDDRVTSDKSFTVVWAGDLQWDAAKNVLFQPVVLQPDTD